MSGLPSLADIQSSRIADDSPLALAISILFEHSPILVSVLQPQLHDSLKAETLQSYERLIDISLEHISKWKTSAQSEFISGHPRIGESTNLSKLSAKEQGAQGVRPTPPEVLARLAHLNAAYEIKYPGLRYITFVNARSRAAIAEEMEGVLGWVNSLSPNEPRIESISKIYSVDSDEWVLELKRAVEDVGKIAKSRVQSFGVV